MVEGISLGCQPSSIHNGSPEKYILNNSFKFKYNVKYNTVTFCLGLYMLKKTANT